MKRFRLIAVVIVVIATTIFVLAKIQRGPRRLAEIHTGIDIPKKYRLLEFEDAWHINGDGKTFIVFSLSDAQIHELDEKLLELGYRPLPIEEELADNFVYNHLNRQSSNGLYLIEWEGQDQRDYKLVVLDKNEKRLIIYYVLT